MVKLNPVNEKNWRACSNLTLPADQRDFVAPNVYTIAESKFNPHYHLRAIYAGDELVGMLAFCHEDDPEDLELYWLFRLLIAPGNQGRGYATEAIQLAVHEMKDLGATRIRTMHKPSNSVAARLYKKLGFLDIGVHEDGDALLELTDFGKTEK